jgi:hypothetical protein
MSYMHRARLIAAVVTLAALAAPVPARDVVLTWKGKTYKADAPPADLSPAQKDALKQLLPWAEKNKYRMDFDAQGRLLLVTPKERSRLQDSLSVVAKAETWFDRVLPSPPRVKAPVTAGATKPAPSDPAPIPEDPEAPPPKPVGSGGDGSGAVPFTAWGSGSIEPDTLTAALVVTRNEEDYGTLVDALAADHKYLEDWVAEAHKHTGFTLEEPLCGAYAENAAGQEEWNGDHELMNRAVQLLTLRRFGQQPNWIVQGIAWECEIQSDGLVYCFPFRKEFVFTAEHGAWPGEVKLLLKNRGGAAPDVTELNSWRRGTWDGTKAKLAWGVVHHLIGQGSGRLSAALEDLRAERAARNRRETGPTSWERIPGYELPPDVQLEALQAHLGKEVMQDAGTSMRTGHVTVTKDPVPAGKDQKPPKAGDKKSIRGA